MTPVVDRLLLGVGLAHALVGIACFARLWAGATPIFGVHPALKPLKFAASIAAFLVTMAVLVPSLSVSGRTRDLLSWALSLSTIVEMAAIGTQALRGRRSHFNFEHPLDAAFAMAMLLGILTLLVTMSAITLLATALPLRQPALSSVAFRAALWIFLFAAVSGFGMGNRGRHTRRVRGGARPRPAAAVVVASPRRQRRR